MRDFRRKQLADFNFPKPTRTENGREMKIRAQFGRPNETKLHLDIINPSGKRFSLILFKNKRVCFSIDELEFSYSIL